MNSNNNQINNNDESQGKFPRLVDQLTNLPCTQERIAGLSRFELEQQPASNGKQIDRDNMYKLWRRDTGIGNVFEDARQDVRQKALSFGEPNNNFRRAMVGPAKERSSLRSGIFSIIFKLFVLLFSCFLLLVISIEKVHSFLSVRVYI